MQFDVIWAQCRYSNLIITHNNQFSLIFSELGSIFDSLIPDEDDLVSIDDDLLSKVLVVVESYLPSLPPGTDPKMLISKLIGADSNSDEKFSFDGRLSLIDFLFQFILKR